MQTRFHKSMSIRLLSLTAAALWVLSACTTQNLTRDLLCNQDIGGTAASRAARCVTAAGIETFQKKPEDSERETSAEKDEDKNDAPRYEGWVP
jgi:hypothetical protein